MMIRHLLYLVTLFVIALHNSSAVPHSLASLSGKVVGTVVTACDHPSFYTPHGHPYPDDAQARLDSFWQRNLNDPRSDCFRGPEEVLTFCRHVYGDIKKDTVINQVVQDPFLIPLDYLPAPMRKITDQIRVYLCLGPSTTSNPTVKSDQSVMDIVSPPIDSNTQLPSLVEVHKAYFTDQLRKLHRSTEANTSTLIDRFVRDARGLVQLYRDNPQQTRYAVSALLDRAHSELDRLWTHEEIQWSQVEQTMHGDLARLLEEEDWAKESKFAYVLQERNPDVHRTQEALAQLLDRLSRSVDEELRHLATVQSRQPWAIRLQSGLGIANWTENVTANVVGLEQVHRVLLKHVRTATMAINTLRSLMSKQPASSVTYLPSLRTAYDRLQARLFEAQRSLNGAKSQMVGHMKQHMRALLDEMHTQLKPVPNRPGDENQTDSGSFSRWLHSKHHSDLAYLDLLISQMLTPYRETARRSAPSVQGEGTQELLGKDPSRKVSPHKDFHLTSAPDINLLPDQPTLNFQEDVFSRISRNSLFFIITGSVLSGLLLITILISCCLCRSKRNRSDHVTESTNQRRLYHTAKLRRLTQTRTDKLRHWIGQWPFTLPFGPPTSEGTGTAEVPVWKVGQPVMVIGTTVPSRAASQTAAIKCSDRSLFDPANSVHGYMNPIYPATQGC